MTFDDIFEESSLKPFTDLRACPIVSSTLRNAFSASFIYLLADESAAVSIAFPEAVSILSKLEMTVLIDLFIFWNAFDILSLTAMVVDIVLATASPLSAPFSFILRLFLRSLLFLYPYIDTGYHHRFFLDRQLCKLMYGAVKLVQPVEGVVALVITAVYQFFAS